MFTQILIVMTRLREALERLRDDQAGYTTETILVTALLVVLALAVLAILVAKVTAKANGINM